VRELTDGQVLEAQLVENLQREDVHPLEEAEGYRELIKLKNLRPTNSARSSANRVHTSTRG
jgi:ParB family chromosome partitioning protein